MKDIELTEAERSRLREAFARVPFICFLGFKLGELNRGAATLELDLRPELTQTEGLMHGGAIASLLDTAAAFAVITLLEPGQKTSTVDLTIHYLRPITSGQITAHARVLRAGKRLVTVAIDVTDQSGTLISTALTTYAKRTQI